MTVKSHSSTKIDEHRTDEQKQGISIFRKHLNLISSAKDNSDSNSSKADVIFRFGLFLVLFIFSTVTASTLLFFVNIPMTFLSLPLGLIIAGLIHYLLISRNLKQLIIIMAVCLLLTFVSMGVNVAVYDNNWDGNWYHKPAAGLLANGWNPVYETSSEAIERLNLNIQPISYWSDYYPKATWIFSATTYIVSGSIDSGKCYNILSLLALFCIGYAYLRERANLKIWQAGLCSFFLAVNPVAITQITSYHCDTFLGSMLLIFILTLLYMTYDNGEKTKHTIGAYLLLFTTACLGMNTKYSALLLFGLFGLIFYLYWIVRWMRKSGWKDSKHKILRVTTFFVILAIFSVVVVGFTSYGTNTINYGNPFYYGDTDTTEVVNSQLPYHFKNLSNAESFIYSIFSPSANNRDAVESMIYVTLPVLGELEFVYPPAKPEFKVPFTFTATECLSFGCADTHIGGWGIMYSGLFIVSLICATLTCLLFRKRDENILPVTTLLFAGVILPGFVVPGLWWARYYLPLFILPIFSLVFLFVLANRHDASEKKAGFLKQKTILNGLAIILCFLMLINIGPSTAYLGFNIIDSHNSLDQINELAIVSESQTVELYTDFSFGEYFNLIDGGVKYTIYNGTDYENEMKPLLYGMYYRILPNGI